MFSQSAGDYAIAAAQSQQETFVIVEELNLHEARRLRLAVLLA